MEIVLYIVIGAVVGLTICYLVMNKKHQDLVTRCEVLQTQKNNAETKAREEAEHAKEEMAAKKEEMDAMYQKLLDAKDKEHQAATDAQNQRHDEAVKNLKDTFDQTVEHLQANVKAATEELLTKRQEDFSRTNKTNMEGIVNPLNETIKKMQEAMKGYTDEQHKFSGSLEAHVKEIVEQANSATKSAEELTTALKHKTKVQGDYGEAILDEILSTQGFTQGIHYDVQPVMKDEAGRQLKDEDGVGQRPDVIFHIDKVRDVIIDSKINLTDFINYANADNEEDRKKHLDRHVKCIEKQVKLLSSKNYFKYDKKTNGRMDYVIMFIPISAAWWEALRHKPDLWRMAMESNVYIADEQTLFAALRIIKLTWTQIYQMENQKQIFDLANEMINRVGIFMEHYTAMGALLKKSLESYEGGYDKLVPNGQSIIKTAEKLIKLGAQDSANHPIGGFLDVENVEQLPKPGDMPSGQTEDTVQPVETEQPKETEQPE